MFHEPARKIKASAVKNVCKFPSTKSGLESRHKFFRMILVESLLEKDYCFILEDDKTVLRYYPQPITFLVSDESFRRNREYTPDFEVHFEGGRRAYIEIKRDFSSLDELYLKKLEIASIAMRRTGYDFLCVDETQIRAQPRLSNLKRLQRYRNPPNNNIGALSLLKSCVPDPQTLNDLVRNPLGVRLETIYALIANGQIAADLSESMLSLRVRVGYV